MHQSARAATRDIGSGVGVDNRAVLGYELVKQVSRDSHGIMQRLEVGLNLIRMGQVSDGAALRVPFILPSSY